VGIFTPRSVDVCSGEDRQASLIREIPSGDRGCLFYPGLSRTEVTREYRALIVDPVSVWVEDEGHRGMRRVRIVRDRSLRLRMIFSIQPALKTSVHQSV